MIELSFNEVELTFRKAALALGWQYGIAEEIGRAAVWLGNVRNLNMEDLLFLTERGANSLHFDSGHQRMEISEPSINVCISGFDLLAACPDRFFTIGKVEIGFGAVASLAGAAAQSYELGYRFQCDAWSLLIRPDGWSGISSTLSGLGQLEVSVCALDSLPVEENARRLRIEMSEKLWRRVSALAAETYVPATEASRRHGAGAELGAPQC